MYKSFYYIYIVAKNTVGENKKVVFQMINHIVFLFFSLFLYKHVYEILPNMQNKLPLPNAIWSMAVYFMVFWLGIRNLERNFRNDIQSGNIEIYLLRPLSYIWQKVLIQVGWGIIPFIFATLLSVIICFIFVGLPIVNASILVWVLGVFIILILSQILTVLIYILCGLSAFWIENSEPIYFVVSKLIMVFGGAWVPIAFFPKAFQMFAQFSPFGASMSISLAMYPNFLDRLPLIILNCIFWILFCYVLLLIVKKRAFKRLAVNG